MKHSTLSQVAYDDGRQAQYDIQRAGDCWHSEIWKQVDGSPDFAHCRLLEQGCPTDYRECPLKKEKE